MKASKRLALAGGVAALFLGLACGQDYNSNSGDERYKPIEASGGACDGEAGARFCAARQIISDRCLICHSEWSGYDSSQTWIDSNRVSPGNSAGSKLIQKLINAGGDMPQGGPALPDSEYTALKAWIDQLAPAAQGVLK